MIICSSPYCNLNSELVCGIAIETMMINNKMKALQKGNINEAELNGPPDLMGEPISIQMIVSTSLFAFVNAGNEFVFCYVFIKDDSIYSLACSKESIRLTGKHQ